MLEKDIRRQGASNTCCIVCACTGVVLLAFLIMALCVFLCVKNTINQESITLPLVKAVPSASPFTLQNMSVVPEDLWRALKHELNDSWVTDAGYSFGYASMDAAPRLLYNGSKVHGVWETVPQKLRGVYWMRDNPLPEVLAVIQYGRWFEEQQTLLLPNSPWTWAWYGSASSDPPSSGSLLLKAVYSFSSGRSIAESYTDTSGIDTVVSFVFDTCPAGTFCTEGSTNLTYATLMSHANGNLTQHGMVYYTGYTMEEMPEEVEPGSLFFRRAEILCGKFGRGSGYRLTKILNADGAPIEPYYTEYRQFMAGRPLIIWSGLPGQ